MELFLITFAVLAFLIYVGWVYSKYGVLSSISHSVYQHNKPWLFFGFMTAIGLAIVLLSILQASYLMAVAGVLFIICGSSPYFRKTTASGDNNMFESILHTIGAEGGIIIMLLHFWIYEGQWYWIPVMLIPTLLLERAKNHTWWIELLAFSIISVVLFINI